MPFRFGLVNITRAHDEREYCDGSDYERLDKADIMIIRGHSGFGACYQSADLPPNLLKTLSRCIRNRFTLFTMIGFARNERVVGS